MIKNILLRIIYLPSIIAPDRQRIISICYRVQCVINFCFQNPQTEEQITRTACKVSKI